MSKGKTIKLKFVQVDDMTLATALMSKGYEIEDCNHSPKHKRHTYLFLEKEGIYQFIEDFKHLKSTVEPVYFFYCWATIHKNFHEGCNEY